MYSSSSGGGEDKRKEKLVPLRVGVGAAVEDSFAQRLWDARGSATEVDENAENAESIKTVLEEMRAYVHEKKCEISFKYNGSADFTITRNVNGKEFPDTYLRETLHVLFVNAKKDLIASLLGYLNPGSKKGKEKGVDIDSLSRDVGMYLADLPNNGSRLPDKIEGHNKEHKVLRALQQSSWNPQDLKAFEYVPSSTAETDVQISEEFFKQYNTSNMLAEENVRTVAYASASRISGAKFEANTAGNAIPILAINIDRGAFGVATAHAANEKHILVALNLVLNINQVAYLIVTDQHHWGAIALRKEEGVLHIYQFDSMSGEQKKDNDKGSIEDEELDEDVKAVLEASKKESEHGNITSSTVDAIKEICENKLEGKPFNKVHSEDLSVYVQRDNNCGLAAGLFVGGMYAFLHGEMESSMNPKTDSEIHKEFKGYYSTNCLSMYPSSKDVYQRVESIASIYVKYSGSTEDPMSNIHLTNFLRMELDLRGQRYFWTRAFQAELQHMKGEPQPAWRPENTLLYIAYTILSAPVFALQWLLLVATDTIPLYVKCIFSEREMVKWQNELKEATRPARTEDLIGRREESDTQDKERY